MAEAIDSWVLQKPKPFSERRLVGKKDIDKRLSLDGHLIYTYNLIDGRRLRRIRPITNSTEAAVLQRGLKPADFERAVTLTRLALRVWRLPTEGMGIFNAAAQTDAAKLSDRQLAGCVQEAEDLSQDIINHWRNLFVQIKFQKELIREGDGDEERMRFGQLHGIHIKPTPVPSPYLLLGNGSNACGALPAAVRMAVLFEQLPPLTDDQPAI